MNETPEPQQGVLFWDLAEPEPAEPEAPEPVSTGVVRPGNVPAAVGSGLWIHRAERADRLVAELGGLLAGSRQDPFAPDVICVPTRGVERWITQQLSHTLGVSAGIEFPSPARLMSQCLAVAGPAPEDDPWAPQRLVHPLLHVIDEVLDQPGFELLREYVVASHGSKPGRRWAAAQLLADLFTEYGVQRPGLVRSWAAESPSAGTGPRDAGPAVPSDLAWQQTLFARLRSRIPVDFPAARTPRACEILRADPAAVELPAAVHVFGPTRLARDQVAILMALAQHRELHLWLVHPSPHLWGRVRETLRDNEHRGDVALPTRLEDPTAGVARHPLLQSWARDCRELQAALMLQTAPIGHPPGLAETGSVTTEPVRGGGPAAVVDLHHPMDHPQDSMLRRLQASIVADDAPLAAASHGLSEAEAGVAGRSVQVHACHGPARQVEVLREVLLHLLAGDPTLSPRDIVVMCPEVETYAPLLAAAFGLSDTLQHLDTAGWDVGEDVVLHPGQQLRIRIADRSLRQTNPVLAMVMMLLDLATRRLTVSELLDFAAQPVVRRRFGFSEDDLERVREWSEAAGVRWGLNADHRGLFGVAGVPHNTWAAGMDRLLVGVAMGQDSGYLGTGLPLDEVDSTQVDLAGRWAEFVSRIGSFMQASTHARTVTAWVRLLNEASVWLAEVEPADAWMAAHAEQALSGITADVENITADNVTPLAAADVRQLLAARFAGRPTRAGFRTGDITVCSLAPMRSVPHRVVCLLGMDDGQFPRRSAHEGEDILLRDPLIGERDRNSEDRQLLLDAVMAATDTLVVLYSGADEVSGRIRPPAVPIAELLDAVGDASVVSRHPLQPFDSRNFIGPAPFSHDALAWDAAARRDPGAGHSELLDVKAIAPMPAHDEVVDLEELIQFFVSPPRAFLRQRLGLVVRSEEELESEQVPLDVQGLAEWGIADRMLKGLLSGLSLETVASYERRRGHLPPAHLGTDVLDRVARRVSRLRDAVAGFLEFDPRTEAVRVELPVRPGETPMVVQGIAGGLRENRVLTVTPSRLAAQHRMRSWITTLALAAGSTREGWQGVTLGRADSGDGLRLSMLTVPEPDQARTLLADLVRMRRFGLDHALPLPLKTSGRYAESRQFAQDVDRALAEAERLWADSRFAGEQSSPEFVRIWGSLTLSELAAIPLDLAALLSPRDWPDEAGSFGRLARRLWVPLLEVEEMRAG